MLPVNGRGYPLTAPNMVSAPWPKYSSLPGGPRSYARSSMSLSASIRLLPRAGVGQRAGHVRGGLRGAAEGIVGRLAASLERRGDYFLTGGCHVHLPPTSEAGHLPPFWPVAPSPITPSLAAG